MRLSRRNFSFALAAVAGGVGLGVLLALFLPSGSSPRAELEPTAAMAPTATPASPSPVAVEATLQASQPAATAPAIAAATFTNTPRPAGTSVQTPEPTATSVPSPTATEPPTSTPNPTATLTARPTATPSPTPRPPARAGGAIVVDHSSTDIAAIPQAWIEEAKRQLHIAYGHTSHGRQLTNGMAGLIGFANSGGLGLSLPREIFQFSPSGNNGGASLHLFEGTGSQPGDLELDLGFYPTWVDETRAYLGAPDPVTGRGINHSETNVIIWSWCGLVSAYTQQQMLEQYLLPMSRLEADYPGVTFVYMTGHADGTGEGGNLHLRNQQIRDYAVQNGKVLYDFYDIELYDPDGNYYGDKLANGQCDYDSDGDGTVDRIWCHDWQMRHTQGVDWYTVDCPHSYPINCNQKAFAAWWLWARLAGWDGKR